MSADRDIILRALAGTTEKEVVASEALGFAFERCIAEARRLVECFDEALPATDWLLATAHLDRLEALSAFVREHLTVGYFAETESEAAQ